MSSAVTEVRAPEACANCGAVVTATFCGQCGQKAGPTPLTLRKIAGQYLQEVLDFERGMPLTLVVLLTRPGRLTSEYLSGRRIRYVSPLRLYTLTSVIAFALFVFSRPLDQAFYGYQGHADWEVLSNALAYGLVLSIPIFTLALKLLYVRTWRPLVEHLVFTLHLGTAVLLFGAGFLVVDTLTKLLWKSESLAPIDPAYLSYAIPLLLAAYLFRSLQHVYREKRSKTLAKGAALLLFLVVMSIGIMLGTAAAASRWGTPVNYADPMIEASDSGEAEPGF